MEGRMMLRDAATGRWGWYTVTTVRMPWEGARARLAAAIRRAARGAWPSPPAPPTYDLDPATLRMVEPERERRQRRIERRDRLIAKMANALKSMIEMQKFIK